LGEKGEALDISLKAGELNEYIFDGKIAGKMCSLSAHDAVKTMSHGESQGARHVEKSFVA